MGCSTSSLPVPQPSPGICASSCPLNQWCYPTISFSAHPFSFCLQFFPALGSFLMSQLFTSSGQSIGASALASALPMNIQGWFPLGFTDLISLQSKGLPNVFSSTTIRKHQFFCTQPFYGPALTTVKIVALTIWIFVSKVKSLIFKMLSRFRIAFLSWSTASSDFMACSPGNNIYCVFSFCVLGTCLSPYLWLFIPIIYLG